MESVIYGRPFAAALKEEAERADRDPDSARDALTSSQAASLTRMLIALRQATW